MFGSNPCLINKKGAQNLFTGSTRNKFRKLAEAFASELLGCKTALFKIYSQATVKQDLRISFLTIPQNKKNLTYCFFHGNLAISSSNLPCFCVSLSFFYWQLVFKSLSFYLYLDHFLTYLSAAFKFQSICKQ